MNLHSLWPDKEYTAIVHSTVPAKILMCGTEGGDFGFLGRGEWGGGRRARYNPFPTNGRPDAHKIGMAWVK